MKVFHTCQKNCLNYRLDFFSKVDCARDIFQINVEGPTEKLQISHDLSKRDNEQTYGSLIRLLY